MMLILRDDPVIEVFASPDNPPNWIEPIDIENEEYSFCDDNGQRYAGLITQPAGWFRPARLCSPSGRGTRHGKCYCARRSCGRNRT